MSPVARYESRVVRNSRLMLGLFYLLAIACWLMAPCFLILAGTSLFPLSDLSFNGVIAALSWLAGAFYVGYLGWQVWSWLRIAARSNVLLDPAGAHFRILMASRKEPQETTLAWNEIISVTRFRIGKSMVYSIGATDKRRSVVFTPYTFLRAKHVAKLIAAGAGKELVTEKR